MRESCGPRRQRSAVVNNDHYDRDDDICSAVERAAPSPTEKGINPTGGNLFTSGVTANPAPNVPPDQHPGINGNP